MFSSMSGFINTVLGRGQSCLSVPIMDGAFKPNNLIEQAKVFFEQAGLEDMVLGPDSRLYAAIGSAVVVVNDDGAAEKIKDFDADITAIGFTADGALAVALGDRVIIDGCQNPVVSAAGKPFVAVNALSAGPNGSLLICDASARYAYSDWRRDLMTKESSGRVVQHNPKDSSSSELAGGLGHAFGVFHHRDDRVLVSESWRHRLCDVSSGKVVPVTAPFPAYPARITGAGDGGFWVSLFSARTQLVEFVLTETDYRTEMMATIAPEYWVAPALSSGKDFYEPLQGGGVKQMGILKPWAPPRSYGLVVKFGADLLPQYSLHSRVGGQNHGITAVIERGDDLFVLSKGAGRILQVNMVDVMNSIYGASQ